MNADWRGRIVKSGAWAGWRVTNNRAIALAYVINVDGSARVVDYKGPFKCACWLEDPNNLMCTASGIIYFDDQLLPLGEK